MSPEVMHPDIFYHQSIGRIDYAVTFHEVKRRSPKKTDICNENIDACKTLYRIFLEDIIQGLRDPCLSPKKRGIWVDEAYQRSDFDWKDWNSFEEFCQWIEDKQDESLS